MKNRVSHIKKKRVHKHILHVPIAACRKENGWVGRVDVALFPFVPGDCEKLLDIGVGCRVVRTLQLEGIGRDSKRLKDSRCHTAEAINAICDTARKRL